MRFGEPRESPAKTGVRPGAGVREAVSVSAANRARRRGVHGARQRAGRARRTRACGRVVGGEPRPWRLLGGRCRCDVKGAPLGRRARTRRRVGLVKLRRRRLELRATAGPVQNQTRVGGGSVRVDVGCLGQTRVGGSVRVRPRAGQAGFACALCARSHLRLFRSERRGERSVGARRRDGGRDRGPLGGRSRLQSSHRPRPGLLRRPVRRARQGQQRVAHGGGHLAQVFVRPLPRHELARGRHTRLGPAREAESVARGTPFGTAAWSRGGRGGVAASGGRRVTSGPHGPRAEPERSRWRRAGPAMSAWPCVRMDLKDSLRLGSGWLSSMERADSRVGASRAVPMCCAER